MDVFNTYLNNIFAAYQETEHALRLKEALLMTMEEKYRDLILEGLSHDAAVGKVMSEFGTIDELADELELRQTTPQEKLTAKDEEMIEEYQLFMKDYSMKFAAAIALFFLPLIIAIFFDNFNEALAGIGFLAGVAIALFFLLSVINQKEYYVNYFKNRQLVQFLDQVKTEDVKKTPNKIKANNQNTPRSIWSRVRGNIWLIAVAIYLVAGTFFNMWGTAWVIFPIATAILAFD